MENEIINNFIGKQFNKLTVLEYIGTDKFRRRTWKCLCECGNTTIVCTSNLIHGHTKSCGCYVKESRIPHITHGQSKTRLYEIWSSMKKRCNNPNCKSYKSYGARGINVCKEWNDFEVFHEWAIKNGYNENLTIDRKDNNQGYSPDNCRWVDSKVQQRNRRSNHLLTYKGETKTLIEWCELLGFNKVTLRSRLESGWTVEEALSTPVLKRGVKE